MLSESYAGLKYTLSYSGTQGYQLKTKLSYLAADLKLKSKLNKIFVPSFPHTQIKLLKWKDASQAEISEVKYKFEEEHMDFKRLRIRLRSISEIIKPQSDKFKITNYVSGPAMKF